MNETSKASVLRSELESTSQAIKTALTNWKPTIKSKPNSPESEDPNSSENIRLQSILNNAEAYRHSAFIYLYRTIHSHPRSHPCVQQHTHASLLSCYNVVQLAEQCRDGPMSALLWPLFVAAVEAITPEDRILASEAFEGTEKRQGMNNIVRAREVVREVWRRIDIDEGIEVDWREICMERGFNIIFG